MATNAIKESQYKNQYNDRRQGGKFWRCLEERGTRADIKKR